MPHLNGKRVKGYFGKKLHDFEERGREMKELREIKKRAYKKTYKKLAKKKAYELGVAQARKQASMLGKPKPSIFSGFAQSSKGRKGKKSEATQILGGFASLVETPQSKGRRKKSKDVLDFL